MGFLVTAHIFQSQGAPALKGKVGDKSLGWALYRDDGADAWLLDAYATRPQHPFTQTPYEWEAPAPAPLRRFYAVLEDLGVDFLAPAGLPALNMQLSKALGASVLSLSANDDDLDFTCLSANGALERVAVVGDDFLLMWEGGRLKLQPLLLEEDPDMQSPALESLGEEMPDVAVAPRNIVRSSDLHWIAREHARAFLGGKDTWLDLGSFDCLQRVPAPVARSA
jgi:hypothetical protein